MQTSQKDKSSRVTFIKLAISGWLVLVLTGWGLNIKAVAQENGTTPTVSKKQETEATPAASGNETDEVKQEVKEKVSQRLQNIVYRKVALVGTLSEVTDDSLVLSVNGSQRQAKSSEDTVYLDQRKGEREIKKEDLELGQSVIVMGWQKADEDLVEAKRVVEIEPQTKLERQVVVGEIQEVAKKGASLTLTETGTNQEWEVTLTKSGQVVSQVQGEITEVDWDEAIDVGKKVVVLSVEEVKAETEEEEISESKTLTARLIYIYPLPPTPTPNPELSGEATNSGEVEVNNETDEIESSSQ
jgi:spore coat protein CotF